MESARMRIAMLVTVTLWATVPTTTTASDRGEAQKGGSTQPADTGGFVLTSSGKCTILMPSEAGRVVRFAGAELARHLEKITGVTISVRDIAGPVGEGSTVILRLEKELSEEAFVRRVGDGRIEIAGGSERGVLYGVYDLLETVGCRWLTPGQDYVPRLDPLAVLRGESPSP